MTQKNVSISNGIFFFITGLFLVGYFLPETFWVYNNLSLYSIIPVIGILTGISYFGTKIQLNLNKFSFLNKRANFWAVCFGLITALLAYLFPIASDYFGDAYYIQQDISKFVKDWDPAINREIFSPDFFNSKVGLHSFYQLAFILSYLTGLDGLKAVTTLEIGLAFFFGYLWTRICFALNDGNDSKLLFSIIGITSPLLAVFMSHYETYAISYVGTLGLYTFLFWTIKQPSKIKFILLPIVFLLNIQTHITNWMHLPALILCFVWNFKETSFLDPLVKKHFNWKGISLFIFFPFLIVGALAYFFVFDAHNGPRLYDKVKFDETVFLPFFTDEAAPLDRYNLFSFNHIWDYLSITFLWSSAIVFLLILALTVFRKKINWNSPLVIISGTSTVILFTLFFFLNPLLGMVIDWDLFSTPGISAMIFTLCIYGNFKTPIEFHSLSTKIIGLCLLSTTFWFANADADNIGKRVENFGKRNFKTYWIGTSTELFCSIKEQLNENYPSNFDRLINELEPFAVKGKDEEFANLIVERAEFEIQNKKWAEAKKLLDKAYLYSPLLDRVLFTSITVNFELKSFKEALKNCQELININHPDKKRVYAMAVHISLANKDYQNAANYAYAHNKIWNDSQLLLTVEKRLATGDNIDKLIHLFRTN